ncbi:MAG TPA: ABC transporter substrate-binding protein [Methylomirabilota bacterium]|nr:ABC transporter substrate-binding protein [Methylomirabilota bacterium]
MRLRAVALLTILVGILTAPLAAEAQQAGTARRIGMVGPPEEPRFSEIRDALRLGLREQGFAEPSTEILEARTPRSDRARAAGAIEGLVRQRVEVLFVIGSALAKVVRQASQLPVVFITPGDPVAAGLVASLGRPGRNMTAITFEYPELSGKRLELLHELVPSVKRVLVLYDPRDASPRQGLEAARAAASRLGLTLVEREVRTADDVTRSLDALTQADALLGIPGGLTTGHYVAMIQAAHAKGRPTVFHARTESTAAALVTYGASDADVARDAARSIAKILRGADAGELPVQRPSKIAFVINLKAAKALGLTIPPSLLLRADQILE